MKDIIPYFKYLKPYKWHYLGGLISGIINGAMSGFGMAFITAKVLPYVFSDEEVSTGLLIGVVLLIPLVALFRGVSGFFSTYLMGYCNQKICLDLRYELMTHLQALSLAYFHRTRTGNVMARILNDTQRISSTVTMVTTDMVRQPVTILSAFAVIAYLSYEQKELGFLAISFLMLPLCIAPIRSVGRKIGSQESKLGMSEGGLHSIIHENVASVREIRAFNLQALEMTRFRARAEQLRELLLRLMKLRGMISPGVEVLSACGVAGAIFYAARCHIGLETMVPLLIALYMCYDPFKKVGVIYADIKRAGLAIERVEKVYQSKDRLVVEDPQDFERFASDIEFDQVAFGYNRNLVVQGLTVKISKGEVVALVGQSGSGKSTFCNLLGRFYDPRTGAVRIDGIDMKCIEESKLREHMAFVPQDCFLFADTILENVRLGRLGASDEEVIEASKRANAHEFITELGEGYETVVAERGASLSGGQRQRIAIARAFLRDSEILILDEATSALDTESERKVQTAIDRLMVGKTVIFIAHRFSTIQMADRVLLFENGGIVDDGSVDELLARSEAFRRIKSAGGDTVEAE
ncbi:MAG: ABC transporter ATP-binding protein [Opitutae bacterium]|nr:ABC transporter ATP-binding protein [Opitutae bacterium]